jgi:EmrB/QacA subfamily drug resistance transporter
MSAHTTGTKRTLVLLCITLSLFMSAIEVTIVATAMPKIVRDLGGFSLYSWVFSAFLLTQTATTVIFGKLSDIYGRKHVIIGGTLVFLIGSIASGLAWSMESMILFRLIQGIGAGAMQPIAVTIAGDLYPPRERLRIQGVLSGTWAAAAILGPFAGGVIAEYFSWSWIFWINVPIGILTIAGFVFFMREDVTQRAHSVDYPGAVLFLISVGAALIALTQSATLGSTELLAFLAVALIAGALFIAVELRAPEPMIAFDLWGSPLVGTANAALLSGMMAVAGVTSYLPMYFQGVLGYSAVFAGFPLSVMMVSWPMASAVSGTILKRFSARATLRFGACLIPIGAVFLLFLKPGENIVLAGIGPAMMGFGMGLLNIVSVVTIQGSVEWNERGSATASLLFSRTLGNTVGVAMVGAILNAGVVYYAHALGLAEAATTARVKTLLTDIGAVAGGGADPATVVILDRALHLGFWGMLGFGIAAAAIALLVPVRELDTLAGEKDARAV